MNDPTWESSRFEGRECWLLTMSTPGDQLRDAELPSGPFVCFVAWDAKGAEVSEIDLLANRLLDAGAIYFCCWGPDCERVHDVIDEVEVARELERELVNSVLMTSWHANEPIGEALWFALSCAYPPDCDSPDVAPVVLLAIGEPVGVELRRALAELESA